MKDRLRESFRFMLWALALGLVAVLVAYFFSGLAALLVAGTLIALVLVLRPLLLPPEDEAMKIRMRMIEGVFALVATHGSWSELVDDGARKILAASPLRDIIPHAEKSDLGQAPSILVLAFVAVCIWIISRSVSDKSIGGGHPTPLKKHFPDPSFERKLQSFCAALRQHLITTDRESNWSPDYYTELEAEVEVSNTRGSIRRSQVTNLQRALRQDRTTQAFLTLGDPGSGKSVALRKLARDMLDEVGTTGRVPIYINLREWLPSHQRQGNPWSEADKPTVSELETFVVSSLSSRGDVFTEEFVKDYFRPLWLHGRLFFIFDSFDEIPELLDAEEETGLVNALSEVISKFVASNPLSRGVVASRSFRRPTELFLAQKTLEIRPLTEEQIVTALERYPAFTAELRATLFRNRLDLVPVARNPFLMALIGEWVSDYHRLPENQAQLYENYLKGRLAKCRTKLAQLGLSETVVLQGATEIAWFLFNSPNYGLEAPARVINEAGATLNTLAIIDALSYARIARVTRGDTPSFAFVHRRFLEYLVTTRLLQQPERIPVEHIPTDSRGRDALVLYAQICDLEYAQSIAGLCWREISSYFHAPASQLRAVHCLRYLIDAFRSRRSAVEPFASELAQFIGEHATRGNNLVHAKLCLEGTGLLAESNAMPILLIAMEGNNSWLRETAFRACRQLPRLNSRLARAIESYILTLGVRQFWSTRRALAFSLSLSESLQQARRTVGVRYVNTLISALAAAIAIAVAPMIVTYGTFMFLPMVLIPLSGTRLRVSDENQHRSGGFSRIFRWLRAHVGTDLLLQSYRLFMSLFFMILAPIFVGEQLLHRAALKHPEQLRDRFDSGITTVDFLLNFLRAKTSNAGILYPWNRADWLASDFFVLLLAIAYVAVGALSLDWLVGRALLRQLIHWLSSLRQSKRIMRMIAKVIAVFLGYFVLIRLLILFGDYINSHFHRVIVIVATIGIMAFGGFVLVPALHGMWRLFGQEIRDRRTFKALSLAGRLERAEIASAVRSLETERWQLAVVRVLTENRVTPIGEWPADFPLAVAASPVITELAKLEERWLRLDR